ncbi:hypothetical protein P3T76_005746 [Phytophthora citrophthora]|uniref:Helicase-associated domain-containing protein n=1 Tax=Phytophthora citrophthora TaxID=4793 RepID=A0AAD9GQE3_9STRA|nr:hypothetical protein P3T76_005746 [Phytophthora citrophthora]
MLRFVWRCHRPLRSLQLAPVPSHLASSLARTPRYHQESEPYQVPSGVRSKNALVWQKTVNPALRSYIKLNNDPLVPYRFVVPFGDDNWPEDTWGYPLGKHVVLLRHSGKKGKLPAFATQDLKEMGFAFEAFQYKWDHYFMPALVRYFELNGNSDVHAKFRIEIGDVEWPEKLWGFPLGAQVSAIRSKGIFKDQVKKDKNKLEKVKFCFDVADREWDTRVLPSLRIYWQEFGNCNVPSKFEVPDCLPWPKAAAGLRLGIVVKNIRSLEIYAKQFARDAVELKELGFVWDHQWAEWNERVFPALETFKLEKGNDRITKFFVVPCTTPWPEKSHGLQIGVLVSNIRCYSIYFDQIARSVDRLASIGFKFQIVPKKWNQRVEPLLATFDELHGHRDVPIDFVVPSEAPWEEKDWGIQLGKLKRKETYYM